MPRHGHPRRRDRPRHRSHHCRRGPGAADGVRGRSTIAAAATPATRGPRTHRSPLGPPALPPQAEAGAHDTADRVADDPAGVVAGDRAAGQRQRAPGDEETTPLGVPTIATNATRAAGSTWPSRQSIAADAAEHRGIDAVGAAGIVTAVAAESAESTDPAARFVRLDIRVGQVQLSGRQVNAATSRRPTATTCAPTGRARCSEASRGTIAAGTAGTSLNQASPLTVAPVRFNPPPP